VQSFRHTHTVEVEVPRDRDGRFEPKIVKKRQRRLDSIDEVVLSLTARGLTTGEISAHFADVYGASVSKDRISRITDKVVEEMTEWAVPRPDRSADRSAVRSHGSGAGQQVMSMPVSAVFSAVSTERL
jgi:transposase-like protein